MTMDLTSKRSMFCIKGALSKNGKTERLPMSPEFFEIIDAIPQRDRRGYVFNSERNGRSGPGDKGRISRGQVSDTLADFGREANVKVKEDRNGDPVFASAHDCRRSFGFRWAKRVMPPILQRMMRYYVTQNVDQTADAVWDAVSTQQDPLEIRNSDRNLV